MTAHRHPGCPMPVLCPAQLGHHRRTCSSVLYTVSERIDPWARNRCPSRKPDPCDTGWCSEGASRFHPGAAECFREVVPWMSYDPGGSQCCYDANGDIIVLGPAAGTAAGTYDTIAPAYDKRMMEPARIHGLGSLDTSCRMLFLGHSAVWLIPLIHIISRTGSLYARRGDHTFDLWRLRPFCSACPRGKNIMARHLRRVSHSDSAPWCDGPWAAYY